MSKARLTLYYEAELMELQADLHPHQEILHLLLTEAMPIQTITLMVETEVAFLEWGQQMALITIQYQLA